MKIRVPSPESREALPRGATPPLLNRSNLLGRMERAKEGEERERGRDRECGGLGRRNALLKAIRKLFSSSTGDETEMLSGNIL